MGKIIFEDFLINKLNKQQLNRFSKYFVAMCFSGFGLDIISDAKPFFTLKSNNEEDIHIYVRTARTKKDVSYSFIVKSAWQNELSKNVYVALVLIGDNNIPSIFLIPAIAWGKPNALLVDRNYKDKKSLPEWGINTNQKNMELLMGYEIKRQLQILDGHH